MGEQLPLPEMGGDTSAQIHTVSELGVHDSVRVRGLGDASLTAVLEARQIHTHDTTYHHIHRINRVAWVDFTRPLAPDTNPCWPMQQQNTTYVTIGREQRGDHHYSFASVQELLEEGMVPEYTVRWLRRFIAIDRPHPPIGTNRTDAIRSLVATLPPLAERTYVKQAVRNLPSLANHYRQFGYRFKGA